MRKLLFAFLIFIPVTLISSDLSDSLRVHILNNSKLLSVNELAKYCSLNYSGVWTLKENVGFVGDSLIRLRVKFCSLKKINKTKYLVNGFINYKNITYSLFGNIKLREIRLITPIDQADCDPNNYPYKKILAEGIILADFIFSLQNSTSIIGACSAAWFIDSINVLHVDNRRSCSDDYVNNQFAGIWMNSSSHEVYSVAWGDYRIPFSRDLDIGVGEFCPNEKYASRGWQTYLDAYFAPQNPGKRYYQMYPEKDSTYWPCNMPTMKHSMKNR